MLVSFVYFILVNIAQLPRCWNTARSRNAQPKKMEIARVQDTETLTFVTKNIHPICMQRAKSSSLGTWLTQIWT